MKIIRVKKVSDARSISEVPSKINALNKEFKGWSHVRFYSAPDDASVEIQPVPGLRISGSTKNISDALASHAKILAEAININKQTIAYFNKVKSQYDELTEELVSARK